MPVRPESTVLTRRALFGAAALAAAGCKDRQPARDGVPVGEPSWFVRLVPAAQVEAAGAQQYRQLLAQAAQAHALLPPGQAQLERLRAIAARLIPFASAWNPRASQWRWEVNAIASPQLNAMCLPGGKILFFYGILERLRLSDAEVAIVMGHEIAHALREHARARLAKTGTTRLGVAALSTLLGFGNVGDTLLQMGGQLLTLRFSRADESEADLVGMELAARAGYDPAAALSLWRKMGASGAPPAYLATHPSGATRSAELSRNLPRVAALYAAAPRPPLRFPVASPLPAPPPA
ncbi:MAG: M48 family metallopeptidase [Pelomonas sp.]|nr:M48 family metallopeptidase [Roseateles sp.]